MLQREIETEMKPVLIDTILLYPHGNKEKM